MPEWTNSWVAIARHHLVVADERLGADRFAQARRHYLPAVRCAALALDGTSDDADRRAVRDIGWTAFRAALPLLPHRVEPVDEPGSAVQGYLCRPAAPRRGAPAVLYEVDGGALAESGYLEVAEPALDDGMVCLLVRRDPDRQTHSAADMARIVEKWRSAAGDAQVLAHRGDTAPSRIAPTPARTSYDRLFPDPDQPGAHR